MTVNRKRRKWILGAGVALLLGACDSQERQNDFVDEASLPPARFAHTNAFGDIIDDDKDDWRTAPAYGGKVGFDPAFPNPTASGLVTLPVQILEFNGVQGGLVLRGRDGSGNFVTLGDLVNTVNPGSYVFRFNPALLGRTGLIRVFVFDRLGELVSYGDIQVGVDS